MGAGAVLLQSDDEDIEHPICYFSKKKINVHQKNYSTIEKECLALILVIQHIDIYILHHQNPPLYTQITTL